MKASMAARSLACVRLLAIASLAACGGAAAPAPAPGPAPPGAPAPRSTRPDEQPAIDPIAALAPDRDGEQVSRLVPGRVQLELGGTAIEAPGGDHALEVGVIERQGSLVRAAVRLPHARFSVWTERAHLLAQLRADHRLTAGAAHDVSGDVYAVLRAGASVRRLERKGGRTRVRFVGAVEVEGWVPDELLADSGPRRGGAGRIPTGRPTLHVLPGAVIRTEPRWSAAALATLAGSPFVDSVRELDPPWVVVAYADSHVSVRGYLSRTDPPGRVHRPRGPDVPPLAVAPNARVPSGTCLYARPRGEAIGYVVGDRDVELDELGGGWWTLALDTPWGAIAFAARGPTRRDLAACAPPGSVPPPAGTAPPAP
jgi:hypothetical protein